MAQKVSSPKRMKSILFWLVGILAVLPIVIYLLYRFRYDQLILPRTYIGKMEVTGLTEKQARAKQMAAINQFLEQQQLTIKVDNREWQLPLKVLKPQYNPTETAFMAYANGRTGTIKNQITTQWQTLLKDKVIETEVTFDEPALETWLATLSGQLAAPPIPPRFEVNEQNKQTPVVKVLAGQNGSELDQQTVKTAIKDRLTTLTAEPIQANMKKIEVVSDPATLEQAKQQAQKLLTKELTLTVNDPYVTKNWQLSGKEMVNFIDIGKGWDQEKISTYLSAASEGINREPTNAKFNFSATTNKVEEFVPAKNGLQLNVTASSQVINQALETLINNGEATQAALVVAVTKPEVSLENANELGIKELLGRGNSTYKGSIPNRVHNVGLAASRINGTLVPPGETFSFNEAVGEVSQDTGYQQAYIIRNGRTELGDGGGVCQDSTTVFRAALAAGLPIAERKAHAYRVGYYEQDTKAGIDATVYAPSPDMKFINDTPGYILIQAKADEPKRALTVEIYGTSDGRTSAITNHTVWDVTPPPPDVYIDDPTMKTGQVKQVDWKAGGAKAKFDYAVTRNGQTIYEKTFYSTYKPWAAVFIRGTAP